MLAFRNTQQPWIREEDRVLFVNCGSLGKPKDGALHSPSSARPAPALEHADDAAACGANW